VSFSYNRFYWNCVVCNTIYTDVLRATNKRKVEVFKEGACTQKNKVKLHVCDNLLGYWMLGTLIKSADISCITIDLDVTA
jgi:hypothetical protein